jgi:hypothetical protein
MPLRHRPVLAPASAGTDQRAAIPDNRIAANPVFKMREADILFSREKGQITTMPELTVFLESLRQLLPAAGELSLNTVLPRVIMP